MKLRNTKTGETLTIKGDWEIIPDEVDETPPIHAPCGPPYEPSKPSWINVLENGGCLHRFGSPLGPDGSPRVSGLACNCPRCSPKC